MKKLLSVLALLVLVLALPVSAETTKVGIKVDSAGAEQVSAGTGTGLLTLGGVLCKGAPAAATAGTTEEVLATCTIPANTLSANGATISVQLLTHTAANANNKRLRIRVGGLAGTVVGDSNNQAVNNNDIAATQFITRLSATTSTAYFESSFLADKTVAIPTKLSYADRAAATVWANALDLVITGTTPTASGDLTLDTYVVEVAQ